MLRIGVTGGIGSGKTTVCRVFEVLGIPVYYADAAARTLMETDPGLITGIRKNFGGAAYNEEGKLNRKYISDIVFRDEAKLSRLNSLVHPATIREAARWMQLQTTPYAIKEAALMFESESFHHTDKVIGIYAPKNLRIQRAMKRDAISREEVLARMNKQLDEEVKMHLCDYIIYNDEQQLVIPQVMKLHGELQRLTVST